MRSDHAKERRSAPRLIGIAGVMLAILIVILVGYSGGASALPGATDLSITKTGSPNPVVVGNNITYAIKVTNPNPSGGADAASVVVTDNLPSSSQVDYISATPSIGGPCTKSGNTVTCPLGTIVAGTSPTVTIVVKARKAGTVTNKASVASDQTASPDSNANNNSATATTTVVKAAKPPKKGRPSCAAPTIKGTAGDDTITGTSHGDVIVTYTGNDVVFAGGGSDLICTDGGADTVFGQGGNDTIIGGAGPDRLVGGIGSDVIKGKNGRDRLKGNAGNDVLNGGKKRDVCKGGSGHNILIGCP
jgi:uncharacterized repeat protein (TIGR01451 family)